MVTEKARNRARWAYRFFMASLIVQAFHFSEHIVQLHQWVMYVPDPEGIFGHVFNFVWVHFLFNTALFVTLGGAYWFWMRDPGIWKESQAGRWMFHGAMGLQGYHVIEHAVQMYQYYVVGMPKPPGIIGEVLAGVLAHFDINALFLILQVGAFLAFRPKPDPYELTPKGQGGASGASA